MHRFETGHGLEPDVAVAHGQVGRFDERVAQRPGQEPVLEVGLAERTRREDHDARVVDARGSDLGERQAERGEPGSKRFDAAGAHELRVGRRQDLAVLQRVARARRCLCPVHEHRERAVGHASDVGGVQHQVASAARWDADAGSQVVPMADDRIDRQQAGTQQPLLPEDVGEHGLEDPGALHQCPPDRRPLGPLHHHGDRIEAPAPVVAAVHLERCAVAVQPTLDPRGVPLQRVHPRREQVGVHPAPDGSDRAGVVHHLVAAVRGWDVEGRRTQVEQAHRRRP